MKSGPWWGRGPVAEPGSRERSSRVAVVGRVATLAGAAADASPAPQSETEKYEALRRSYTGGSPRITASVSIEAASSGRVWVDTMGSTAQSQRTAGMCHSALIFNCTEVVLKTCS